MSKSQVAEPDPKKVARVGVGQSSEVGEANMQAVVGQVALQAAAGAFNYVVANPQQVAELFGRLTSWRPGRSEGVKEQLADLTSHVADQDKAIAFLVAECESLHNEAQSLEKVVGVQRVWLFGVGAIAVIALLLAVFL